MSPHSSHRHSLTDSGERADSSPAEERHGRRAFPARLDAAAGALFITVRVCVCACVCLTVCPCHRARVPGCARARSLLLSGVRLINMMRGDNESAADEDKAAGQCVCVCVCECVCVCV